MNLPFADLNLSLCRNLVRSRSPPTNLTVTEVCMAVGIAKPVTYPRGLHPDVTTRDGGWLYLD